MGGQRPLWLFSGRSTGVFDRGEVERWRGTLRSAERCSARDRRRWLAGVTDAPIRCRSFAAGPAIVTSDTDLRRMG